MMSLLAAQYGTVSDIELVWTLLAFVGGIFSIYNIREALADYRALSNIDKGNGRGLIARVSLKSESARLIIQIIFFTIGVLAMLVGDNPYPPGTPLKIVILGFVFRWGLITASLLVTLKSYWGYQVRKEIKDQVLRLSHLEEVKSATAIEAHPDEAIIVVPPAENKPV